MKITGLWLSALLWISACAPTRPILVENAGASQPTSRVEAHADVTFTPRERAIIQTAADYLETSAGVRYRIVFDLELTPESLLQNQIMRPPSDAVIVTLLDARFNGTSTRATVFERDRPFRMWLMADRMPTTFLFLHVAEHELLHGVGCNHVNDSRAVLYSSTHPGTHEALELNESDRAELERVRGKT